MKKLTTMTLAATALIPAIAMAQTVAPPERWQDTPDARLRVPGAPPAPNVRVQTRSAPMAAPQVRVRTHAAPPVAHAPIMHAPTVRGHINAGPGQPMRAGPRQVMVPRPVAHAPAARVHMPVRMRAGPGHGAMQRHHGPGRVHRFPHVGRINRGFFVPPFWFGPQFHVQNWGLYGFSQPYEDRRWVRYYDDALLIDREGRVHDGRYGLDWDEYGEDWNYDRGIPEYVGDGDYQPDEEDYAYVEGEQRHAGRDRRRDSGYDYDDRVTYGGGYGHGGYGYAYGYPAYGWGWGWGWGYGGVTITETTVTTAPVVTAHIVYEYEEVAAAPRRRAKKRHYRPKPRCEQCCDCPAPAAPRPPYGEKG